MSKKRRGLIILLFFTFLTISLKGVLAEEKEIVNGRDQEVNLKSLEKKIEEDSQKESDDEQETNRNFEFNKTTNVTTGGCINLNTSILPPENIKWKRQMNTTGSTIILTWDNTDDNVKNDVSINKEKIESIETNKYIYKNLDLGRKYIFNIRSRIGKEVGVWSDDIEVTLQKEVILNRIKSINVTKEISDNEEVLKILWDTVQEADNYSVQVNGQVYDNIKSNTFIHKNVDLSRIHGYRIKANNKYQESEWSEWELFFPSNKIISKEINKKVDKKKNNIMMKSYLSDTKASMVSTSNFTLNAIESEEEHKVIVSKDDLVNINNDLVGSYILLCDIDLKGSEWQPLQEFKGKLNGNGYKIHNVSINKEAYSNIGIFQSTRDSEISNLTIDKGNIKGASYVGAFAGASYSSKYINCRVTSNCEISGRRTIGGLVGYSDGIEIENCSVSGIINGIEGNIGGLIGYISNYGRISTSYTDGEVNVKAIKNNYKYPFYAGGLVGAVKTRTDSESYIKKSYSTVKSQVQNWVHFGGLVGVISPGNQGAIKYEISNSFTITEVNGESIFAGLVEKRDHYFTSIINCYSASMHDGLREQKGIGEVTYHKVNDVKNSYFDNSGGKYELDSLDKDFSRFKIEMIKKDNYKEWDFNNIWDIDENSYPHLRNLAKPNKVKAEFSSTDISKGSGVDSDPFIIENKEQFNSIRYGLNRCYKLGNNIDLESIEWKPIGIEWIEFSGIIDGAGFKVMNLVVDKSKEPYDYQRNYAGVFGYAKGASIINLSIENAHIKGNSQLGILIGNAKEVNIENCNIIGENTVNGELHLGGLVGYGENVNISKCGVVANIKGLRIIGGVIGYIREDLKLDKSYFNGTIISNSKEEKGTIGGLIGYVNIEEGTNKSIDQCYSNAEIEAINSKKVGAFIGNVYRYPNSKTNEMDITNSFAIGKIQCLNYGYGLIGFREYSTVKVKNCYSSVEINDVHVKGLIEIGHLRDDNLDIENSYFDNSRSRFDIDRNDNKFSRLKKEMIMKENYEGWDFNNIWDIDEKSYPHLRNLKKPEGLNVEFSEKDIIKGNGTEDDPYLIENASQFDAIRKKIDACYKLVNDIDLSEINWFPIAYSGCDFTGQLDGNGYKIKNLNSKYPTTEYTGLFGHIKECKIKNLKLENVNIQGNNGAGGIAGEAINSEITNCSINFGNIKGKRTVGGIIGLADNSIIIDCRFDGIIESEKPLGGIVGWTNNHNLMMKRCSFEGEINQIGSYKYFAIGGILGGIPGLESEEFVTIEDCYTKARINCTPDNVGGIIGIAGARNQNVKMEITNCYSDLSVNGNFVKGGIIGRNTFSNGIVENNYTNYPIKGYGEPDGQIKSDEEMKSQGTYAGWDFENVWTIDEGVDTPKFRDIASPELSIVSTDVNEIVVKWNQVEGVEDYELSLDGLQVGITSNFNYKITNLESGKKYRVRVRGRNSNKFGLWSEEIEVITPIEKPTDVTVNSTGDTNIITWGASPNADYYEIIIDKSEPMRVDGLEYTHSSLEESTYHAYLVRAVNEISTSHWTDEKEYINWSENKKYCVYYKDTELDDEKEVYVRTNMIDKVYSGYLEFNYDNQKIEIINDSLKGFYDENQSETYNEIRIVNNVVADKIIVSRLGEVVGTKGETELIRMRIKIKVEDDRRVEFTKVDIVDSLGKIYNLIEVKDEGGKDEE